MSDEVKFEAFMQRVMQRPLPSNPMAQIRTLAKELADGSAANFWKPTFSFGSLDAPKSKKRIDPDFREQPLDSQETYLTDYVDRRWGFEDVPNLELLVLNEYLHKVQIDNSFTFGRPIYLLELTRKAFELVDEIEPAEIFISYRRKESSAFALLVLARLKEFELNAFLDMTIRPGDNWHAYIKEQIQQRDYFVLLLGKETLASSVVKDEILWAIEANAEIIPIWHNGYEYANGAIDLPDEISRVLGSTHTIRVLEESALAYNNAIVELLNRFGIMP